MGNIFQRKRPPRVINICGHKIKVRIKGYLEADGQDLLGAWVPEIKTIYLLKNCDWRSVLLHEVMHAILSLSGANEGLSMTKEEGLVLALEYGLIQIILGK